MFLEKGGAVFLTSPFSLVCKNTKYDGFVKSRKTPLSVIPAKAGHVVALFKP